MADYKYTVKTVYEGYISVKPWLQLPNTAIYPVKAFSDVEWAFRIHGCLLYNITNADPLEMLYSETVTLVSAVDPVYNVRLWAVMPFNYGTGIFCEGRDLPYIEEEWEPENDEILAVIDGIGEAKAFYLNTSSALSYQSLQSVRSRPDPAVVVPAPIRESKGSITAVEGTQKPITAQQLLEWDSGHHPRDIALYAAPVRSESNCPNCPL